jgi:tol-pal system protein YbgF
MTRLSKDAAAVALAGALILAGPALSFAQDSRLQVAQSYGVPPDNVGGGGDSQDNGGGYPPSGGGYAPQGGGSDDASLLVRVERLEDQIRQMTGEIQQMQFQNHQLQDQLKKFQEDVDFRFQERSGRPARHSELPPENPPAAAADSDNGPAQSGPAAADALADSPAGSAPRSGRDDAFDPTTHPDAPGAPKPLGTTGGPPPPIADNGGSAGGDSNAPLNLPSAQYTPAPAPAPSSGGSSAPAGGVTTPGGTMIASAEPNMPRQEFDVALGYFKQKDYDNAQRSFAEFIDKNPKSRLTAEALYFLGESYAARGRTREAAEQFLKISTNYTASSRAPEAMLRLGESLRALGAKEQACATFSEVPHKYPNASAAVKAGAEREAKRTQCGA